MVFEIVGHCQRGIDGDQVALGGSGRVRGRGEVTDHQRPFASKPSAGAPLTKSFKNP